MSLELALQLAAIAREAGREILRIYAAGFSVEDKPDHSPITSADRASNALICARLAELAPDIPVLAEESDAPDPAARAAWPRFFCVDPLDGTKEFIKRNGEFTVNIALVEGTRPILGVVHPPVLGLTYLGGPGLGAWRASGDGAPQPIHAAPAPASGAVVLASLSHPSPDLAAYLAGLDQPRLEPRGAAYKFCLVAEGSAHLYPRFNPTMEWDTAAGQAILEAAGGAVLTLDGAPLAYNKPVLRNPGFLARGPLV